MAPAQSRTGQRLDHRGLWHLKGQPDVLKNIQVEAQLNHQHLITHLIGKDRRTIFTPDRVSIESESGVLEESRDDPRSAYRGQSLESPWDDLHVAYFASYALWSHLTIPFLYTYPGFVCEELAPWKENGEAEKKPAGADICAAFSTIRSMIFLASA